MGSFGITLAAPHGKRMEYRLAGAAGLERLSGGITYRSEDAHRFHARFISVPLESIAFEDLSATPFSCSPLEGSSGPYDDLVRVVSVVHGVVRVEHASASLLLAQGEVALVGTGRFRLRTEDATRIATVILPRSSLRSGREDLEETQSAPVSSPLVPIWLGLMRTMATSTPEDNTRESELLAHAVLDIARGLIAAKEHRSVDRSSAVEMVRRAHDIIERDGADPSLRPSQVARMLDISERRLHRLFANEELSVGECIRSTRVDAAARYLLGTLESFGAIAARVGFGSSAAAHRAFRAFKNLSPAEYRSRGTLE